MVEADREIIGRHEPCTRRLGHGEALLRIGQRRTVDLALARNEVRHVGVAEHSQPVRPELHCPFETVQQPFHALSG